VKKFLLAMAAAATLATNVLIPVASAQTPAPPPPPPAGAPVAPAANAADHDKLEAALKQLNLTMRQKIQIGKIVKAAKANGQDKKVTMKQISGVLSPDQMAKLKQMLDAKASK